MAPEQINGETGRRAGRRVSPSACCSTSIRLRRAPVRGGDRRCATVARVLGATRRRCRPRCPAMPRGVAEIIARCLRRGAGRSDSARPRSWSARSMTIGSRAICRRAPHATWWRAHQIDRRRPLHRQLRGGVADQGLDGDAGDRRVVPGALRRGRPSAACCAGISCFTELMNRPRLAVERMRTSRAIVVLDLLAAALLFADGVIIAATRACRRVLTASRSRARHRAGVDRARAADHSGGVWRGLMIAIEIREPGGPRCWCPWSGRHRCRPTARC